jgi:predicted permease
MMGLGRVRLWVRALFRPGAVERELSEELRHHIELEAEKNLRAGLEASEARRRALLDFGGEERFKEQAREARSTRPLEDGIMDLRYGMRQLRKHPGFTVVALLSLALGIGANTAIFSVVNSVLLRPLPFDEPDRILVLEERYDGASTPSFSPADFLDLKRQVASFEAVVGFRGHAMSFLGSEGPERIRTLSVSPDFFRAFGARPSLGRFFQDTPEEETAGKMVVLSHPTWNARFGGDPSVLGRSVSLSGEPHVVVGVAPASFQYPEETEMWVRSYREGIPEPPVDVGDELSTLRDLGFFQVRARLAEGATLETARAELEVFSGRLAEIKEMEGRGYGIDLVPLQEFMTGDVRATLLVLLGAVGLVLLIACANVANLLLARAASRASELAVRTAMGATRSRIFRQLLVESLLLGGVAGVAGLGLARWGFGGLLLLLPTDIPRLEGIDLDGSVLLFTLMASLATGIVFGLFPALQASRTDLAGTIKEGGRGTPGGQSNRSRELLVVSEVALSVVLLAGAALMLKSLAQLQREELGFEPEGILTARMTLPEGRYPDSESLAQFSRDLLREVRNIPGVISAGMAMGTPFGGGRATLTYDVEGILPEGGDEFESELQAVSSEYFPTLGVPLLAGRWIEAADEEGVGAPGVALINEALALRHWGSPEGALGQRVRYLTEEYQEIVGVVGNFRQESYDRAPRPEAYVPFLRAPWPLFTVVAKTRGDPATLMAPVRQAVLALDPLQPLSTVRTMETAVWESVGQERFTVQLLGLFAALAMSLALVGVYGVMSYMVSLRVHEIGVRVALGAARQQILWLSLRSGVRLAVLGLVLGLAGSLALTQVMRNLLYGVRPWDPVVLSLTGLALAGAVVVAAYLPARKAAGLDPALVLRDE